MIFTITVESGEPSPPPAFASPRKLEEGMTFRVGRQEGCEVRLGGAYVSGLHGELVFFRGHLYFRDLKSTNGSHHRRGEALRPLDEEHGLAVQLRDGDAIIVGDAAAGTVLRVQIADGPSISRPTRQGVALDDAMTLLAVSNLDRLLELQGQVSADPELAARLFRASQLMDGSLDMQRGCRAACAAIFDLLPNATHITVLLDQQPSYGSVEAAAPDLVPYLSVDRWGEATAGERPSRVVQEEVLGRRAAVLVCDTADMDPSVSMVRNQIRSLMGAPLAVGERIIGVIQVDNRSDEGAFTPRDLEALLVLTRQMALTLDNARLYQRVKGAEERAVGENHFLKAKEERLFRDIIGHSSAMQRVMDLVARVQNTRATILITGETGTGKELIARAIHYRSNRRDKLFIAQNCSAIPENLLESELFGHRKGAFTGADADKKGLFEIASGGTIFLDEIGETTAALQAKLLRVLQESEVRPVGALQARKIDARVIAATNRNLQEEVEAGNFREDLYYRLNVFPIHLPPLRDRRDDIPLLAEHFLRRFSAEYGRPSIHFSPEATMLLQSYPWPGNIRELENELQRIVIYGVPGDLVLPEHLAPRIRRAQGVLDRVGPLKGGLKSMLEEVERWILLDALRAHDGNKTRTAEALQITREGLHKKLSRFGIG